MSGVIDGGPPLIAALMGAALIIVGLIFAFRVAQAASSELTRDDEGQLEPGFDDAWWALRHAAYFSLAVIGLGVLLLLVPAIGADGPSGPSESPSPSADAAPGGDQTNNGASDHQKPKPHRDQGEDEQDKSESPAPSPAGG